MAVPDTLLIDEGDLASLTLLALQADPARLLLVHVRTSDGRLEAARMHEEICGDARLIIAEPVQSFDAPGRLVDAQVLLRAAAVALHYRCTRILWPITVGENHVETAEVLDRAATIAQLADPSGTLLVDAPIADLNDAQLVELADESGAPMHAFWPCDLDGEQPCRTCGGCKRWQAAFDAAGVEWPFGGAALRAVSVSPAL